MAGRGCVVGSDGEEGRRDLSVSVSVGVVSPTPHLEWLIASDGL